MVTIPDLSEYYDFHRKSQKRKISVLEGNIFCAGNSPSLLRETSNGSKGQKGVFWYRMHISRKYTVFFRIEDEKDCVRVDTRITIEPAHKKYGKYLEVPDTGYGFIVHMVMNCRNAVLCGALILNSEKYLPVRYLPALE